MQTTVLSLYPFDRRNAGDLAVCSALRRRGGALHIEFTLKGDLELLTVPMPAGPAARSHRLWESTCLEWFVADSARDGYWEFNLSPDGHWNVYRFDAYRQGMREEKKVAALPMEMRRQAHSLYCACAIELTSIGLARSRLKIGLAAVIRSSDGQSSYWALNHPCPKPDFHHPDALIVELAP